MPRCLELSPVLLHLLLLHFTVFRGDSANASEATGDRRCFPSEFLFGTATAAYQVEGAWNETARTPSVWDEFCRQHAPQMECADVTDDFAHRFEQDIELMGQMGLGSFRMSISWSRVMTWEPSSSRMVRNEPGIDFYHQVLDSLHDKGIEPIVTLYHWDLPASLHHALDPPGWLNEQMVDHFEDFAFLVFAEYGTKVKFWSTFNEPLSFVLSGYSSTHSPPGITNSSTAVYTVGHHVLLSHARAVEQLRCLQAKGVALKNAQIGIVLNKGFSYPRDPLNPQDVAAADRRNQFELGWFLLPITKGDYPEVMKQRAGDRLPEFTDEEKVLLRGSYDLLMLNHYGSDLVIGCDEKTNEDKCTELAMGWDQDLNAPHVGRPKDARRSSKNREGKYNCEWFSAFPKGYLDTIRYMHEFDSEAAILLTENGWCGNEEIESQDQLWYFQNYLKQVWRAMHEFNIKIIGYTAWSFMDNYEWGSFDPRFGLFFVNHTVETRAGLPPSHPDDLKRIPRLAAHWFGHLVRTKCLLDMTLEDLDDPDQIIDANAEMTPGRKTETINNSHAGIAFLFGVCLVGVVAMLVGMKHMQAVDRRSPTRSREQVPLLFGNRQARHAIPRQSNR